MDSPIEATLKEPRMRHYTVRFGDTLWDIAERCYGDGQLWSHLAENNPLARAGVLYEGQCLEVPPARPQSLADADRHALPLGHAPVKVMLDGSEPLCRYDGFAAFGLSGLVGELIFHRHGNVHLGELSVGRLLLYRQEQLAWARGLFVHHFCAPCVSSRGGLPASTGLEVARSPYHCRGPGYTITGQVGVWWITNVHRGVANVPDEVQMLVAMNLSQLFDLATLVLGELPAPLDASPGKSVPLGRVLRAACPLLISPPDLWALTRDETCLVQSPPALDVPEQEVGWTLATDGAPKQKKGGRTAGRKKPPVEKSSAQQAKARKARTGATRRS